jgi:dienelactone hydrolase
VALCGGLTLWGCRGADPVCSGGCDAGSGGGPDASASRDAGPGTDAGVPPDAGASGFDSGTGDGGLTVVVPCVDTLSDVYVTPPGLPPLTDAGRGDIIRCAFDSVLDAGTVASEVAAQGIVTPMDSGVTLYRIAFRTERDDGIEGVSTARVYLPDHPNALPMPLIDIGHETDGLASACAPSKVPADDEDLALPWAGLGYAVILPDYAGLGNEGAQGYLDNQDQAHSFLDAARALRKLLPPGTFTSQMLASGFSQGGGAVLSAQGLAGSYGADSDLVGVIAFAPQWPSRLNSFGFVDQLENPNELTILTGLSEDVIQVMRTYAYFYNHVGASAAGDGFPDAGRTGIDNAVTSLCEVELGGYLQSTAVHVGDVTDPVFRTQLLACIDGGVDGGGCVDPGKSYISFLEGNFVTPDPLGAKVLYVQGLMDTIMPPASEAACNLEVLEYAGVTPQVCTDAQASHQTVVARNMDFALQWGQALLSGAILPSCSNAGMPACTP